VAGRLRHLWVFDTTLFETGWPVPEVEEAVAALETLVFTGPTENWTSARAHLVLPAAAWVERDGTFTNFEGRVQRFRAAVDPRGEARPEWQIIGDLLAALGEDPGATRQQWFRQRGAAAPFRGLGYEYRRGGDGRPARRSAAPADAPWPTWASPPGACWSCVFVLNLGGLLTWVERKQSAIMQDRIGANRASIFGFRIMGLFHPLADAIKMLTKEDFLPARADRFLFRLAPFVSVFFALVAFASIPFGDTLRVAGREIPLQAITLNAGVLYVFAMLSLGVYGVMMAGWSSANNFALMGGQRAAALMISAEIAIGASIMGVVMVYGSLNMMEIARAQGAYLWGWIPLWGIVTQPLAFVLFLTAGIAATKRIPDTPGGVEIMATS
jgi:formate hydrogenlyase subunit 4